MPARGFVIRFPDGDFEYDFTRAGAPSVGETLRRKGSLWSVVRINDDDLLTVHVAAADDEADGASLRDSMAPAEESPP